MNFWKLRAAISDHRLTIQGLQLSDAMPSSRLATAEHANKLLKAAFIEAGLDPAKNYTVNDDAESFTLVDDVAQAG